MKGIRQTDMAQLQGERKTGQDTGLGKGRALPKLSTV